jgi:hypothetical protein
MITLTDFRRLYSYKLKFENNSACSKCNRCGNQSIGKKQFLFLYPGELTYRASEKLFPVFHYENSIIVDGDRLYACPLIEKGSQKNCKNPPLVCCLCPANIFIRKNQKSFALLENCKRKTVNTKWFGEATKAIVDLYVSIGVGTKF